MSGVLESLQNPLERLSVLPTTTALRTNPLTNSPVWDASVQYFKNDIVISSLNGGAYVMWGGTLDLSSIRGPAVGGDPSLDPDGVWQKLTQTGQESYVPAGGLAFALPAPLPVPPAACAWTITNGTLADVPAGSEWMAVLQYDITYAAPMAATEYTTFTVDSDGVGIGAQNLVVPPFVGQTQQTGSLTFVVGAGTGPTAPATIITIRLTASSSAAVAGAYPTAIVGKLSWIRLA